MPRIDPIKPNGTENTSEIEREFRFQGFIEGEENRGTTLSQLRRIVHFSLDNCFKWREQLVKGSKRAPTAEQLNFHYILKWLVGPGTRSRMACPECAFVEMLTDTAQSPVWYVSHGYNGKISEFLSCVESHYQTRDIGIVSEHMPYWVCAFALRASELEFQADIGKSGFQRAIQLCRGTLLILSADEAADPFRRAWCSLEMSLAADRAQERGENLRLDVAICHMSNIELLTAGLTDRERKAEEQKQGTGCWAKECREKAFPIDLLCNGTYLAIEHTRTTDEAHWSQHMNFILGRDIHKSLAPAMHDNYNVTSRKLRAEFAMAAWRRALLQGPGVVEEYGLAALLAADVRREVLVLDFFGLEEMIDAEVVTFARGLPPSLLKLELCFVRCGDIGNRGVEALSAALPSGLRTLLLDFSYCGQIGDPSVEALARNLPSELESLRLRFKGVKGKITNRGAEAISRVLPTSLHTLELDLSTCEQVDNRGLEAIAVALQKLTLNTLQLDFWMCGTIDDYRDREWEVGGFTELAFSLPPSLDMLQLRLTGCRGVFSNKGVENLSKMLPQALQVLKLDLLYFDQVGDAGLDALGQHLPLTLNTFHLKVEGCDKINDAGLAWVCDKMPTIELQSLLLHFEFCNQITSRGVAEIAERLPPALLKLDLNFGCCKEIKDEGVVALAEKLPSSLQDFRLDLKYCKKVGDKGLATLGKRLPASVTRLALVFGDCELIYDSGVSAFAKRLPGSLEFLELNFWRCQNVGDQGIAYIAKYLPSTVKVLQLTVDGTKVSPEKRAYCTGIDTIRKCKPTQAELQNVYGKEDHSLHTKSQIGWMRRHGPHVEAIDRMLAAEAPTLEPVSSSLFAKLGSQIMAKSSSCPNLRRKATPISDRLSSTPVPSVGVRLVK